jgi:AbrB family looped-hinge helix DNA binding protein
MTYTRKVTKKGQVTIPKDIRDAFGIDARSEVIVYASKDDNTVVIKPASNLTDMREKLDIDNPIDPVKAREIMANNYERE